MATWNALACILARAIADTARQIGSLDPALGQRWRVPLAHWDRFLDLLVGTLGNAWSIRAGDPVGERGVVVAHPDHVFFIATRDVAQEGQAVIEIVSMGSLPRAGVRAAAGSPRPGDRSGG
jgi:hypothetical protein